MKNTFKVLGIIAIVAIIGLAFAACGDGGGSGDNNGGGSGGSENVGTTLTISNEQVYTMEWTAQGPVYTPFDGTVTGLNYVNVPTSMAGESEDNFMPLNDVINGNRTVTLTNGKLSISMGTPKPSVLLSFDEMKAKYPSLTINPSGAKGFGLGQIHTGDNYESTSISRNNENGGVSYFYSDKNVTIRGTYDEVNYDRTYTYDIALELKTGWNTTIQTITQLSDTSLKITVKTGKPTANDKWVYQSY